MATASRWVSIGVEVRDPNDLDSASSVMTRKRAGALVVRADPLFLDHRTRIVKLASNNRLPTIFSQPEYVEAGGLMSYGVNIADLWRRAATYVDKILKGAKPGDIPVEQAKQFEFIINLKTAKQIGVTIPPNVLLRHGSGQVLLVIPLEVEPITPLRL